MRHKILALIIIVIILGLYFFINKKSEDRLVLAELGYSLKKTETIADVTYIPVTAPGVGNVLYMQSTSIVVNGTPCHLGVFYTIPKNNISESGTFWTEDRLKGAMQSQNDMPPQVKEVGDTYVVFEPSQSACALSGDQTTLKQEGEKRLELWKALSSATKI